MRYNDAYDMKLHRDDHWIDTIHLCGPSQPLLRLTTQCRYKTSGLSGDEWRTSTVWQCTPDLATYMQGDLAAEADGDWLTFDGGYHGKLDVGCAALFPRLFSSQPRIHAFSITMIAFLRKGQVLYGSSYDGQAMPLLTCAGHLPWALIHARDQPLGLDSAWNEMKRLCFQPGCAERAVSTYRLKQCYRPDGSAYPAEAPRIGQPKAGLVRRFCPRHLQRGDCGREDADANYEVLDGPGPREARGWKQDVSVAQQVIL